MEFGAIYTIWLREIKRFMRAKSRILGSLVGPVVWLSFMGVGLNSTFSIPNSNFSYLNYMAPGIIGMSLLFSSVFSGVSVIWEKQFGFLKEILVAPVSRTTIALGKIAGSSTISMLNGLMVLIIATLIGAISVSSLTLVSIPLVILFMILISFSFVSLGLIIASKLNNMDGFQLIMGFLVLPLFFLSGAFFPIQNAPTWMQALAFLDPLMYGVDGLRAVLLGVSQLPILLDFTVLVGFSVVMIFVSSLMFRKIG